MKLTNLVTSQPLSKRLDKLLKNPAVAGQGGGIETQFAWYKKGEEIEVKFDQGRKNNVYLAQRGWSFIVPAFLSGELGERLKGQLIPEWSGLHKGWFYSENKTAKTEAEARGLKYEYLLKNNLIKAK